MTSSRSRASTSNAWIVALLGVLVVLVAAPRDAGAGGRKRLVVLDFEGPKAEKFQDDVVKLLKKSHTVLATSKWNQAAEDLGAADVTDKNIKKVAKKLKLDGVIEGKIDKRRDEYIVKLKLHGKDGDVVATVSTKAEAARLDGSALRDVKDELVPQVEALAVNRAGGGGDDDDGDAKPAKKKPADDDDDDKPAKKKPTKVAKKSDDDGDDDADAKPKKKGFGKKTDDEVGANKTGDDDDKPAKKKPAKKDDPPPPPKKKAHDDEDDTPLPKAKKPAKKTDDDADADDAKPAKKKKVAHADDDDGERVTKHGDDDDGAEVDPETRLSPGNRAVDLIAGLSLNARRMSFTYASDLGKPPPGYKGVPVGGLLVDATLYPAALSHKRTDMLKNLGVSVMVDKVVKISSKVNLNGTPTTLDTSELRYAVGAVFRYPFNTTPTSPVIGGSLRYSGQAFTIARATEADIPNVAYKSVEPMVFFKYPTSPKLVLDASAGFLLLLSTGDITSSANYGSASATGFEAELGGDYLITKNVFARAAFKIETIGFKFKGTGMMATGRDNDPAQDVFGARDTYVGGAVTVGYVY